MKQMKITTRVSKAGISLYFISDAPRIQILREQETQPLFGEYCMDRTPERAVCLFDGLPGRFSRSFAWTDETVQSRCIYYYWVRELWPDRETLSHPVAVKVRDERIWWSRTKYEEYMDRMAVDFPDMIRIGKCGRSAKGYPMRYILAGNPDRCIAYVGAVHAGESGPEIILPAICRILENEPELLRRVGVAMLPAANPDQRQRHVDEGYVPYLRTTANGVDINRNFPSHWEDVQHAYGMSSDCFLDDLYKGPIPASETETRAVMEYVRQVRPKAVFGCHWLAGVCQDTLLSSSYAKEDETYTAALLPLIRAYAEGFSAVLGRKPTPEGLILRPWCSNGSLPDWAYTLGIPAFDIEGHFDNLPIENYPEFEGSKEDITTPEMIELCSRGHENAIRKLIDVLSDSEL